MTPTDSVATRPIRLRRLHGLLAALATLIIAWPAAAQLRVVNYNLAQLNGNTARIQDVLEAAHDDDAYGFAVPVSIFIFQEVRDDDVNFIASLVNGAAPSGVAYAVATYTNFGENGVAGAQMCVYNAQLLAEIPSGHADINTGAGRFSDRWKFTLNGYDSPDAAFYIYSSHLKAGNSPDDRDDREAGALSLRNNIATLPVGTHVILAGDLNLYTPSEEAYELLTAPSISPVQMFDPLGSGSWSGSSNAWKHTQSPRDIQADGLIGGGMDDRFDFQLANNDFNDGVGLAFISNTYRALGNDGNHYNNAINQGNNSYFPGETSRSNALADDLFFASDHIPVIADYQIPGSLGLDLPASLPSVIVDAAALFQFTVTNDAPATIAAGVDQVIYLINVSGAASGTASGTVQLNDLNPHAFALDTSNVGPIQVNLAISTLSEGSQVDDASIQLDGMVLRHAVASFDPVTEVLSDVATFDVKANTGVQTLEVPVYNVGWDTMQARLDIDDATPIAAPFGFVGGDDNIAGSGGVATFSFDTTGLADGDYTQVVNIHTSDEDIAGEQDSSIELELVVTVGGGVLPCPEDIVGNDDVVDVNDILILLANWGTDGPGSDIAAPFDLVEVNDLLAILAAWGPCP